MKTFAPIKILLYLPNDSSELSMLKKLVAECHAEAVIKHLHGLKISSSAKSDIVDQILKRTLHKSSEYT